MKRDANRYFNRPAGQSGVALIIGLVLLLTLTILGIGALSTTSLEQRMAGNMGDLNLAFNAAESSSEIYANYIINNSNFPRVKNMPEGWWDQPGYGASWWNGSADTFTFGSPIPEVSSQPRIIVEDAGLFTRDSDVIGHAYGASGTEKLRLTTRGTGYSNNAQVIIQQVIAKRN
ncbi:MAG: pilus assembly protein [Gammaproteobacteria bacterium]|nr:pilus assembly protein [Gammaproteobacteria bacterium]MDH5651157.1 pilus assembly protein [Gammaproteobacteria bacterium]